MFIRLFVEKKDNFNVKAIQLQTEFKNYLNLDIKNLRIINCYEIYLENFKLSKDLIYNIFADIQQDDYFFDLHTSIDQNTQSIIASQYLDGQFDQQSASAIELWNLQDEIDEKYKNPLIKFSSIIVFDKQEQKTIDKIKNYYINEVESKEKIFSDVIETPANQIKENLAIGGFIDLDHGKLTELLNTYSLAMDIKDLEIIQEYFKNEQKRDPFEVELKMLDTYWSDHCRHTTFSTIINNVSFPKNQDTYGKYWDYYLDIRNKLKQNHKPITLMNMATIGSKYVKSKGGLKNWFVTNEINACTIKTKIKIKGQSKAKDWLIAFKNETHNHPTEIEPFGGAGTCLGGAIRDILSSRAFTYQAVRLSGASADLSPVIESKLLQHQIIYKSALGYSSYGNQIGLSTSQVHEFYHSGYVAKRMELGAVLGSCPLDSLNFQEPDKGDLVILIGGDTGRDGIGGATGSSKNHDHKSVETSSAEVQKGNPTEERKIQRLFKNPDFIKLIKKCNDMGAGGISVAIGEISNGVDIHLERVPLKYKNLSGMEIALSESQERMAIVINKQDLNAVIEFAHDENLKATNVATITNNGFLNMFYHQEQIVNLSYDFINTNGATFNTDIEFVAHKPCEDNQAITKIQDILTNPKYTAKNPTDIQATWQQIMSDINVSSQIPLMEMFDSMVGANTLLIPHGGKYQLSEEDASIHKINVPECENASAIAWGFNPYLAESSPLHGSQFALVDSILKLVSSGVKRDDIYLSLQEYFAKTSISNPQSWSQPTLSMLGALYVQAELNIGAIGGKDSMSGTFNNINVPPTLVSFAFASMENKDVLSSTINKPKNQDFEYIYLLKTPLNADLTPNLDEVSKNMDLVSNLIQKQSLSASKVVGTFGIAETIAKMSFGNLVGSQLDISHKELFEPNQSSMILVAKSNLADITSSDNLKLIGKTTNDSTIQIENQSINILDLVTSWQAGSVVKSEDTTQIIGEEQTKKLTHMLADKKNNQQANSNSNSNQNNKSNMKSLNILESKPKVLLPIFVGTNCEYESSYAFEKHGANVNSFIFKTQTQADITQSLEYFAKELETANILMLSGGFSYSDEPNGAGRYMANVLSNKMVAKKIDDFLAKDNLILGICNGFQALIKAGLLGHTQENTNFSRTSGQATLCYNTNNRHIAKITKTQIISNTSPWLSNMEIGDEHYIPISHGEGRLVASDELVEDLYKNNQIVACYSSSDESHISQAKNTAHAHMQAFNNPNGSSYNIEALSSKDGKILGKMAHSERVGDSLYKNFPNSVEQNIFINGINYFK